LNVGVVDRGGSGVKADVETGLEVRVRLGVSVEINCFGVNVNVGDNMDVLEGTTEGCFVDLLQEESNAKINRNRVIVFAFIIAIHMLARF
jgi:hypothetical protein